MSLWLLWLVGGLGAMGGAAALVLAGRRRERQLEQLLAAADDRLESLQRQFERFIPADVVERLTDGSGRFVPERRQVTMLFADLRGFTALCDRLDPDVTLRMLNDYFDRMTLAIGRHHGHVTEFVGDGLLALFGALEPNPWQARDAVLAALEMRAELARYNASLRERGLPALRFGVGIHGGEVIAGIIGTPGLSKYSVTGDPINVASRIEGLTSRFEVDVLVSEDVRAALDDRFRLVPMPPATVKGKAEPILSFHVEGFTA
ncbi:MAG: adenylate/guanylate cyclase domain-containing protein [Rhizobacter sp.]|nr:adenylate/guanylate cyclase domain-containing protein [Rhizobacter sp.]